MIESVTAEEYGADPLIFPIVPDDPEKVGEALTNAVALSDLVLLNAGSSRNPSPWVRLRNPREDTLASLFSANALCRFDARTDTLSRGDWVEVELLMS